jgi:hypothetical protein
LRFAVHRPGCPVASPRSHGVPRRDIPGCVHISVALISAGRAFETRLALTRLRIYMSARRASLASERGFDFLDATRRLVLQPPYQQTPARPQDLPIEPGLGMNASAWVFPRPPGRSRHVPDLQVLDSDQVEPAGEVRTGFLSPILPPVGLAGAQSGDGQLHLGAADRSLFGSGEFALQPTHAPALTRGQAGNREQFSIRQGRRHCHPPVNAHDLAVTRCGNRIRDHGEGEMPAARAVHRHSVGFHPRRHWAGPAEPYPPGLRHPDLAGSAAQPTHLLGLHLDASESLIPPGLAPRRAPSRVLRVEERDHRLGEVSQRLLLNNARASGQPGVLRPRLGELSALLKVAWRARPAGVPMRMLLYRQVPYVSGVGAMVSQHSLLSGGGKQPVPRHTNTLSTSTDISEEVKRRSRPGLNIGASTPRSL